MKLRQLIKNPSDRDEPLSMTRFFSSGGCETTPLIKKPERMLLPLASGNSLCNVRWPYHRGERRNNQKTADSKRKKLRVNFQGLRCWVTFFSPDLHLGTPMTEWPHRQLYFIKARVDATGHKNTDHRLPHTALLLRSAHQGRIILQVGDLHCIGVTRYKQTTWKCQQSLFMRVDIDKDTFTSFVQL